MKKKRSKSPIFLEKCWEIIPRTRVRFDFPRLHQKDDGKCIIFHRLFYPLRKQWHIIAVRRISSRISVYIIRSKGAGYHLAFN